MRTIALENESAASAEVFFGGKSVATKLARDGKSVLLTLKDTLDIPAGGKLEIGLR